MWIGVLWAGLRVAMWITHVGGEFRHGLLEKSLNHSPILKAATHILGVTSTVSFSETGEA